MIMKIFFVAILGFAFFENSAHAIITNFDPDKSKTWAKKSFPNVCEVSVHHSDGGSHGTGVLISPTTVLTAAHVVRAGQTLKCNAIVNFAQFGTEFETDEPFRFVETIIPHPDHQMDKHYYCGGVDLAILKFSTPIENITPVKLYSSAISNNMQGYISGYGGSGRSHMGKTGNQHIRHMGTTRISESYGNYLAYNFQPVTCRPYTVPDTFQVTSTTDKFQSIPVERDSGGPFMLGAAPHDLSLAGIAHGGSVLHDLETDVVLGATFKWTAIHPHLEWIKANM